MVYGLRCDNFGLYCFLMIIWTSAQERSSTEVHCINSFLGMYMVGWSLIPRKLGNLVLLSGSEVFVR